MRNYILAALLLCLFSCSSTSTEKEVQAIKALLQQERKAHIEHQADFFMSEFSDSMISVNKGLVIPMDRPKMRDRIQEYFDHSEFVKWDDVEEPKIHISNDGSMAYAIVQKQVIIASPDSLGVKHNDTTNYAWVSIYRKEKNEWKLTCNVSTNK